MIILFDWIYIRTVLNLCWLNFVLFEIWAHVCEEYDSHALKHARLTPHVSGMTSSDPCLLPTLVVIGVTDQLSNCPTEVSPTVPSYMFIIEESRSQQHQSSPISEVALLESDSKTQLNHNFMTVQI